MVQLGASWLMDWCQRTSPAADETVATAVAQCLLSKRSADEIASELLDLLAVRPWTSSATSLATGKYSSQQGMVGTAKTQASF